MVSRSNPLVFSHQSHAPQPRSPCERRILDDRRIVFSHSLLRIKMGRYDIRHRSALIIAGGKSGNLKRIVERPRFTGVRGTDRHHRAPARKRRVRHLEPIALHQDVLSVDFFIAVSKERPCGNKLSVIACRHTFGNQRVAVHHHIGLISHLITHITRAKSRETIGRYVAELHSVV